MCLPYSRSGLGEMLRVHPLAARELLTAARWCDRERPGSGSQLRNAVRHTFRRVATAPRQGSPYLHGTRRFLVHRFPYSTVYITLESSGHIVAVAHHKRRPGYWRKRLKGI